MKRPTPALFAVFAILLTAGSRGALAEPTLEWAGPWQRANLPADCGYSSYYPYPESPYNWCWHYFTGLGTTFSIDGEAGLATAEYSGGVSLNSWADLGIEFWRDFVISGSPAGWWITLSSDVDGSIFAAQSGAGWGNAHAALESLSINSNHHFRGYEAPNGSYGSHFVDDVRSESIWLSDGAYQVRGSLRAGAGPGFGGVGSTNFSFRLGLDAAPQAACGDGWIAAGESCDDGNSNSSDGCSSTCTAESGWVCEGSPSVCTIPMTFVLNSVADDEDLAPGDGNCAGSIGTCTLRAAITEANAKPGRDRIEIPAGTYRITHDETGAGAITITDDIEIVGASKESVRLTAATGLFRPLLTTAADVLLSDLTIGNCVSFNDSGLIVNDGGNLSLSRVVVENFHSDFDGPLTSTGGHLTIRDSLIAKNLSESGAALWIGGGTALVEDTKIDDNFSYGEVITARGLDLVVNRTTITRNACAIDACVLHQWAGNVTIRDSLLALNSGTSLIHLARGLVENTTISGNRVDLFVSMPMFSGTPDVLVRNSTVVRNESPNGAALSGVVVANSIVAENTPSGHDCEAIESGGYNLFGVACASSALEATDQSGTNAAPLAARLAPLQAYGGPTNMHALVLGSPALDAGNPAPPASDPFACAETDQRGVLRSGDANGDGIGRCDIGAYEVREACSDLLDNDGDGRTDAQDPGCRNPLSTVENPKCQDGLDNDADGRFDFDGGASAHGGVAQGPKDPQCAGVAWRNKEGTSCGLGAELVLMFPILREAARRRRM